MGGMETPEDPEAWLRSAEQAVLDAALGRAPVMGWTRAMAAAAGADAGFTPGETGLILPHGPADLAALLSCRHDAAALWRWAGDVAADENHYTKRVILAGILVSALAVRLQQGESEAEAYVDARIANVMSFEAWKARQAPGAPLRRLAEGLGRLRYGAPVNRRA